VRVDLAAHVVVGCARDQHAARLAKALQPGRDVDAIAQNVVAFDQHVAEIDADAIEDALGLEGSGVALGHQVLDRDRAFDGGDDGGKLQQKPIARRLNDPATVVGDHRTRCLPMLALMGLLLLPEGLSAFLEIAGLGRSKCCRAAG
jgi:hypothetical protein